MFSEVRKRAKKSGLPPGTPSYTGDKAKAASSVTMITYDIQHHEEKVSKTLEAFSFDPQSSGVTWVNVEGLSDTSIVEELAKRFNLHPLTVEDILNVEQRPKVEEFEGYLFITLKQLVWQTKSSTFAISQLSLVCGHNFVLSFQEHDTTLFDSIKKRLQSNSHQRMREHGSDYLVYRLIDTVIDEYFVVLEVLGDQIEKAESQIVSSPNTQSSRIIYRLKRQLLLLRKAIWPMREALSHLMHVEDKLITPFTRVYLRDVYDHTVQAIDTLETFRDMLSSMLDMYISSLTNRMNEVIKTLTIIATIFIPITFIASIYGMNFTYMPELHWRYGYPAVWCLILVITGMMMVYFRRKKWL